ncbi:MAG TPA: hypothetical protein PKH33_13405 [bacterium]|nr:hypothetical protein [bacterium]
MLLSDKDKAFIAECTAELITSSGQTGKRYVPDPNAEKIYGTDDAPFILDCEFPFEFVETPPQILTTQKTDAAISVLPDQEINEGDHVEFNGVQYKVLTVEALNVFGVVSHKVVTVAKLHP